MACCCNLRTESVCKMHADLYTPTPIPVHPDLRCACQKRGLACDGACYVDCMNLANRMAELEAEQHALRAWVIELTDRISRLESIIDTTPAQPLFSECATLVAEPLRPVFNLRDEILKMQLWRLQDGKTPVEAKAIYAAIQSTDEALNRGNAPQNECVGSSDWKRK